MKWIKFSDQLPTTDELKYRIILFDGKNYPSFYVGKYKHKKDKSLLDNVYLYDYSNDKYKSLASLGLLEENTPSVYCIVERSKYVTTFGEQKDYYYEEVQTNFAQERKR